MPLKPWEKWESDVQDALGLRGTVSSGSKFYDISDGVGTDYDSDFRLMADAKCTEKGSYSIKWDFMSQWIEKAAQHGTRFILPIRFNNGKGLNTDYVALSFDDFCEIEKAAKSEFTSDEIDLIEKIISVAPEETKKALTSIVKKMK